MYLITLELRPRLGSCNAFIYIQEKIDVNEVGIEPLEDKIILSIGKKTTTFLLPLVKVIPQSMTSLNISDNWVCFRVQTVSHSVFGSFRTEVLTNSSSKATYFKLPTNNNESLINAKCRILCTSCGNAVTKTANFQRVLPYPDGDYETSDWFCCKHNTHGVTGDLRMQQTDLFCGSYFSIVHMNLFNNNIRLNNNTIICNRCLLHLGTCYNSNSYKLWNCCVDYKLSDGATSKNATDPLHDFLTVIKSMLSDIFGEELILQSFVGKQAHFILIKPMDRHLDLMTETEIVHGNTILLQKMEVIKVLYKYETNKTAIMNNDINRKYYEVGLPVIEAGLKYLLLSSKRFPEFYRIAADLYIGHIHLAEYVSHAK